MKKSPHLSIKTSATTPKVFASLMQDQQRGAIEEYARLALDYDNMGESVKAIKLRQLISSLATPIFENLSPRAQEIVVVELMLLAINYENLENFEDELNEYTRIGILYEKFSAYFSPLAKECVFKAYFNAAISHQQKGNQNLALAEYSKLANLADASFECLTQELQYCLLTAHVNASLIYHNREDYCAVLKECQTAIQLAEQSFDRLSSAAQRTFLHACLGAGYGYRKLKQFKASQTEFDKVFAFSGPIFSDFDCKDRAMFIGALLNSTHSENTDVKRAVLFVMLNSIDLSHDLEKSGDKKRIEVIFDRTTNLWDAVTSAASYWLCKLDSYPITLAKTAQFNAALSVAEGLATQTQLTNGSYTRQIAEAAYSGFDLEGKVLKEICKKLSKLICRKNHWPTRFETVNHWLFAVLWNLDSSKFPTETDEDWQPEIPHAFKVFQYANVFLDSGKVRPPNAWQHIPLEAFRLDASLHNPDLYQTIFDAWTKGEIDVPREALLNAWEGIKKERMIIQGGKPANVSTLKSLSEWLSGLGVANAARIAWEAHIRANTDTVVEKNLHSWIIEKLKSSEQKRPTKFFDDIIMRLLLETEFTSNDVDILAVFHKLTDAYINGPKPEPSVVWRLLESTRIGFCTAAFKSSSLDSPPDNQAKDNLRKVILSTLIKTQAEFDLLKNGNTDAAASQFKSPIEPFSTLAREMTRLGLQLNPLTSDDVARLLEPDEQFVQIYWGASGNSHALIVRNAEILTSIELPDALSMQAFQPLCSLWEPIDNPIKTREDLRSFNKAWTQLTDIASPALNLLKWLAKSAAPKTKVILILPDNLIRLPWLALFAEPTTDDLQNLCQLELATSTSAWCASKENKLASSVDGQVLIDSRDSLFVEGTIGSAESQYVNQYFGKKAKPQDGLVNVLRALALPGPKHILMHGSFNSNDPLISFIKVNDECKLSVGSIMGCKVAGDISLASCSAMMAKQGRDRVQYFGPMGIGPILNAAGARSVIGCLWNAIPIVSFLFYSLWFEERKTKSAFEALLATQTRLRAFSFSDAEIWFRKNAKDHSSEFEKYKSKVQDLGWRKPFDHPWCFAGYTLIGDAPPIPTLTVTKNKPDGLSRLKGLFNKIWRVTKKTIHRHFPAVGKQDFG